MKGLQFLALNIADTRREIACLTQEEKGAYLDLMLTCAENEGRLKGDQSFVQFVSKLSSRAFKKFFPKFSEIFQQQRDGCWRHERIDYHIERVERISAARSEAGRKGNEKRWNDDSNSDRKPIANPSQMRSQNDRNGSLSARLKAVKLKAIKKETRSPTVSARPSRAASPGFSILDQGFKVLGKRGKAIVRLVLPECGPERVREVLASAERKDPEDRIAYFLGACQKPTPIANGHAEPEQKRSGPKEPLTDEARQRILAGMRSEDPPDENPQAG